MNSSQLVGGKGYNLIEMTNIGMPVPPGFVVTTKAFDKFIELNRLKDRIDQMTENCDVDNTKQLMQVSKDIKNLIIKGEYPQAVKYEITQTYNQLSVSKDINLPTIIPLLSAGREYAIVAVRSSGIQEDVADASFAGQHATFLNVKGITGLVDAIRECWASLFEPRAIFYRAKHGYKNASIAVIVQKMVASEKSGTMFTVNPSTGEDNIVIEACWGLGETLVQGEVEPDRYIVSKKGEILERITGKKERMRVREIASDRTVVTSVPKDKMNASVLNDEEILKLAEYGMTLEDHYQKPQDVEFAIEKNRLYIVQTRAITTKGKMEEVKIDSEPIVKGIGASPGVATGTVKIINNIQDLTKIQKGDILVTKMTSPDYVVGMSKSVAIVTDEGGTTSHASIVSRELGIPCIVGSKTATRTLKDGQIITVDAYHGLVYDGEVKVEKHEEEVVEKVETKSSIKVNLAFALENLEEIASKVDGVGLLRLEHMITQFGMHPAKLIREGRKDEYVKLLLDGIRPIAQAFNPKPVWIRTLDVRTDEFRNMEGGEEEPTESNPMLGWHGIRRSLSEIELLKSEFEAVKQLHSEGLTNVHIMIPFVVSVDELKKAKEIAKDTLPETAKLGIMVETPAAALMIEDFCKEGIAFASIGSNDLTQGVLCVDRNNANISNLYSEFHPAVLKMMGLVIKICNKYNVESSICGESGSNPEMAKILIKLGIRSISCNMDAIDKIRKAAHESEQ